MPKYKYSFKTTPYEHQLAAMGAMLNHFSKQNKEFALLMEMGCGKTKVLIDAFTTDRGRKFADRFLMTRQALMAVDESTIIKNSSALRTKAITKLGNLARYRVIMTGSPITKSPEDLYAQCNFLNHDLLGFSSIYTFRARYCQMQRLSFGGRSFNKVTGYKNLEELNYKLRQFSYRVLKKDALDLPARSNDKASSNSVWSYGNR